MQAQAEAGDLSVGIETHRAEQLAQQLDAAARITLVKQLADAADIDAAADQFRAISKVRAVVFGY